MTDKHKILTFGDHPLVPSGVGSQSKYLFEGLLNTGKYKIRSLGGAIRHEDYRPLKINEYGDDWIIYPVDGYGNEHIVRQMLEVEKPDAIFMFTDPRFYIWLFNMSDEIRDRGIPILYNHVWDAYPVPDFNKGFYESVDFLGCISKLTHDIVCKLGLENNSAYIPHAVDENIFKPMEKENLLKQKAFALGENKDKFVVFYNSRNARRKMTSDVVKVFSYLLKAIDKDDAFLLMHCDPHDQEGADLLAVSRMLGLKPHQISFSNKRVPPEQVALFYNIADVTINVSCLPAGTKILTNNGYESIENIKIGENVLTHKGQFRKVVKTYERQETEKVLKIKPFCMPEITITEEHPFYGIKRNNVPMNEVTDSILDKFEFIKAKDLEKSDLVAFPIIQDSECVYENIEYDLNALQEEHQIYKYLKLNEDKSKISACFNDNKHFINRKLKLNNNLSYLMGRWVGDGSTNAMSICFTPDDTDGVKKCINIMKEVFGVTPSFSIGETVNTVTLYQADKLTSMLFKKVCGEYSAGKKIPKHVLYNKDKTILQSFIQGYQDSDGTFYEKNIKITTISKELALQYFSAVLRLGYKPYFRMEENASGYENGKTQYLVKYATTVTENCSNRSWIRGKYYLCSIDKIELIELEKPLTVYNLEVEEDNSYVAENQILHNCNEGFGLSCLESLMCGTPVIVNKTGGLQDQPVDDEGNVLGALIEPAVRSLTGSQQIPYIYDERCTDEDILNALLKMYKMSWDERKLLGRKAHNWALKAFGMKQMVSRWDDAFEKYISLYRNNKNYHRIKFSKV